MNRHNAPILASLALLLLSGAFFAEKYAPEVWNSPLLATKTSQYQLHTPLFPLGTHIPSDIRGALTLTPQHNPVLITVPTIIHSSGTLTIEPGVNIFVHENAYLINQGTLHINGNQASPVSFTSNELNPQNRTWAGLIIEPSSTTTLNHVTLQYATPTLTCQPGSHASLSHLKITDTHLGLYLDSSACLLTDSQIISQRAGAITKNNPFDLKTNFVNAPIPIEEH